MYKSFLGSGRESSARLRNSAELEVSEDIYFLINEIFSLVMHRLFSDKVMTH